ncbi:hypothetical protein BGZ61DRAFT_43999 [Ilyonectria robusta]|uniref:uncharacterized protein n=1 Tax=Ilyonectria robusta TaxID=1079257 RepID=UPI001E8CC9B6|nr:uncharacterized protein BGZ61DRAFT_43999 [Ilyonectria robusta]KAH8686694.1 hypothetical protein BGZ61DRAFT_43999 [Ilyonectria robusta]
MASQKPQDPLDVLQLMVNDVLVQTGKALRASRKDGQGNVAQVHGSLQSKLPDTIRTFHSALDDLEHDIIRAKSVLLRDITQIQERKQQQQQQQQQAQQQQQEHQHQQEQSQHKHKFQESQVQPPQPLQQPQPQPVESQSKEPMVIDLDSSPPPNNQPMTETKATKPVAPFPDMGMGLPDMNDTDLVIKDEAPPSIPAPVPEMANIKPEPTISPAPMAPMPNMDEKPVDINMDISSGDMADPELNFTNMEFTLAPTNNDTQNLPTSQEPSFDLTTFAPTDGGDDLLGLDNLLPPNPSEQANVNPVSQIPVPENAIKPENSENLDVSTNTMSLTNTGVQESTGAKKEENADSTFDELMFMDTDNNFGGGGGGLGEDTFEDLMDSRDDTSFDLMEHGDFDASYFGLDLDEA